MTSAWWGKEAGSDRRARLAGGGSAVLQPELLPAERQAVREFVSSRIRPFTPAWTRQDRDDSGVVLIRLFGTQMEPVLERLNRLPEKILVEHLETAGVRRLPPTAATALLEFTVSAAAPGSVLIPQGFQASADPATGQGDPVIFETESSFFATAAQIAEIHVQEGGLFTAVDVEGIGPEGPLLPFGARPQAGAAVWIGLAGAVSPYPTLSLGIAVAPPQGAPPPVSAGGLYPPPAAPAPLLRWEVLDGGRPVQIEVVRDETGGMQRGGVVELRLPRQWRPSRPAGLRGEGDLRWLRLRIAYGTYRMPPSVASVRLNVTRAVGARTVRDEVLRRISDDRSARRTRMRVDQTPVLPGSLVIEVDEGLEEDVFGVGTGEVSPSSRITRWREVENLSDHDPEEQVFVVDHATGEVMFAGTVVEGFRNVRAVRYRVGGGRAGAVDADAISSMVSSAPFVVSVTNPFPASGGVDTEPNADAIRRGTQELRSRSRAVTPADYALLAMRTPGADIARAHGVAGLHPQYPGAPIPGAVAVFVVPRSRRAAGPPVPDEESLRAVSVYLSESAAPVGVEVVAAAPRYHRVRVEAQVVVDADDDVGAAVRRVLDRLDEYLDPIRGGGSGTGWPFGGPIEHQAVRRILLRLEGIRAVSQLTFVVDGRRIPRCTDYAISPNSLVFPEAHEIIPMAAGGTPMLAGGRVQP